MSHPPVQSIRMPVKMAGGHPASSASGLPAVIRFLLIPSWLVGLGAALIAVDLAFHVIHEPFSQVIGNTVMLGGFLVAPVATLIAVGLAVWYTARQRRRKVTAPPAGGRPGVWTLIGLSSLCILGAWLMIASIFNS